MKKLLGAIADYIRETDKILLLLALFTASYGTILVFSATYTISGYRQFIVQGGAMVIGLLAAVILSSFDYGDLGRIWYIFAGIALLLVGLTFFIGYAPAGSDDKAWLLLPMGLTLQPSELLKVAFILTFSKHVMALRDSVTRFWPMMSLCVHGAIPVLLIHFQGDDGTALMIGFIFLCMLFAAGVKIRYFAIAGGAAAVLSPIIWFKVMTEFQRNRVIAVYFPKEEDLLGDLWQQWRAGIGIASGGFAGKGLFKGPMVRSGNVPKWYNDFIFFSAGEQLGFLGCMGIILLLAAICVRLILIARMSRDQMGSIICVGVFAMFAAQSIVNIGMNLSLLPVIGITLPFFSAGGTSLVVNFLGVGLALSVYIHRHKRTIYLRG